MRHSKAYLGLGLVAAIAIVTAGCQPEPNRNNRRFGRNALGSPNQTPSLASTQVTYVTNPGGDAAMTQVAGLMAAPALSTNAQWALGNVSAQGGVRMWAETYIVGGSGDGSVDGARSRIHIEVADSRVGQSDGVGGTLTPFVLHVGYDWTGFEGAEGGVTDGAVSIRFDQSGYGSVLVTGSVSGNTLNGQLSFVNTMTDGQMVTLGNFSVPVCSFFICQ